MAYLKATQKQIELLVKLSLEAKRITEEEAPELRARAKFKSYAQVDAIIKRLNSTRKFDRHLSPPSEGQLAFIRDLEKAVGAKPWDVTDKTWVNADLRIKQLQKDKREMAKPSAPVIDMFSKRQVS